jgi:WD40-like Beta Propeller Repeat
MDMLPRWSPDGEHIAFISDASGEIEVYVMDPDGGDVRNVSQDPALDDGIYGIDWTPDGSTIVAASMGRSYAAGDEASPRGAIGAIALVSVILGLVVGLLLRSRPRLGTFTIALGLTGVLVGLFADGVVVVAFVLAGTATDAVGWWASTGRGIARVAAAGAVAAALITAITFVAGSLEAGLVWDGELVVGVILLAGLVGGACAALASRPGPGEEAGGPTASGTPV